MRIYPYLAILIIYNYFTQIVSDRYAYLILPDINSSKCQIPSQFHFTLVFTDTKAPNMTITLVRNDDVSANIPVYTIQHHPRKHRITKISVPNYEDSTFYHSIDNNGYFTVQCNKFNNNIQLIIKGSVYIKNIKYTLQPAIRIPNNLHIRQNYTVYHLIPVIESHHHDYRIGLRYGKLLKYNKTKRRFRRSTVKEIFIDILVVTDYAIYNEWLSRDNNIPSMARHNIKRYFSHVINGVGSRYKSIQSTLKISIRLVGIIIAESPFVAPWTELHKEQVNMKHQVNADKVLEALKRWVVNTSTVPKHDHAMLFTGYDLFGNDNGFRFNYTTGLAYIGTMCQGEGRSVSIVEDHGGFQSVGTATHEIGHSLGADHDGTNNTCSSKNRFIMAGQSFNETNTNAFNPWTFSRCSIKYFTDYINSISDSIKQRQCLVYKIPIDPTLPDVSNDKPGQEYSPDQQCRNIYGDTSYLCRGGSFGDSDSICKSMFCRNPVTSRKCVLHSAAEGTSCGDRKWCSQGHCVYSKHAPTRKDGCIFGDQTGVIFEGKTCQMLLQESPGYCYITSFWDRCCESCYSLHTATPGCEFGDKVLHCKQSNCGEIVTNGTLYDIDCCGTCGYIGQPASSASSTSTTTSNYVTTPPCTDRALINNCTCSEFLKINGKIQCYKSKVFDNCCGSCLKLQDADTGCQFGDRIFDCDRNKCHSDDIDMDYNNNCCETCGEDATGEDNGQHCQDKGTVNHLSCTDFLQKHGKSSCYVSDVFNVCCGTCRDLEKHISTCNYGDRDVTTCEEYISTLGDHECEEAYKTMCCYSCGVLAGTIHQSVVFQDEASSTARVKEVYMFNLISASLFLYFST